MPVNTSNSFNTDKNTSVVDKIYSKLPNTLEELIGENLYRELCNVIITKLNNKNDSSDYFAKYLHNNFFSCSCETVAKNIANLVSDDSYNLERLERLINLKNDYVYELQNMIDFEIYMDDKHKKQIKEKIPDEIMKQFREHHLSESLILILANSLDFSKYQFKCDTLMDEVLSMLLVDLVGHDVFNSDKLNNNLWVSVDGKIHDEDSPFIECKIKLMVGDKSILSISFNKDKDELFDYDMEYFCCKRAVRGACKIIAAHTVSGEERGRTAFEGYERKNKEKNYNL